jgi:hypothetical protein
MKAPGAKRGSAIATVFKGRWSIVEMDLWDNDDLDRLEPAYITFEGGAGRFAFAGVGGELDVRYCSRDGAACAGLTWEYVNEDRPASGRGRVALGAAGRLVGDIFIHNGDSFGFVALPA